MVDVDTGYITAAPISSRKSPQLVKGFQECYKELKSKGIIARMVRLDNEILDQMITQFKEQGLDYQLAFPGNHRVVDVERAIGIFKNHFITIRSGTDPVFPQKGWAHLIRHAVITLNMLRPSRINSCISAYTQVYGIFDFNHTSIAPAGCKVVIYDRTDERPSWANHGTRGYYVGPAMKHFRNYNVLMDTTKKIRQLNTVDFFPTTCEDPTITPTEILSLIIEDLLTMITDSLPMSPILPHSLGLTTAVEALQSILRPLTEEIVRG